MKRLLTTAPALALLLVFCMGADCNSTTADDEQRVQTESLMEEMNAQVGMPAIKNFNEKRIAKQIFELRDDAKLMTYTYIVDMNGHQHLLCKSMGYGLPYSVQYTNPQRIAKSNSYGHVTLPQPDPNGLFMPDGLSATWVLCIAPGTKKSTPVYVEPQIIVSPFPLEAVSKRATTTVQ